MHPIRSSPRVDLTASELGVQGVLSKCDPSHTPGVQGGSSQSVPRTVMDPIRSSPRVDLTAAQSQGTPTLCLQMAW